jgi:hypothetical protein
MEPTVIHTSVGVGRPEADAPSGRSWLSITPFVLVSPPSDDGYAEESTEGGRRLVLTSEANRLEEVDGP